MYFLWRTVIAIENSIQQGLRGERMTVAIQEQKPFSLFVIKCFKPPESSTQALKVSLPHIQEYSTWTERIAFSMLPGIFKNMKGFCGRP